MPNFAAVKELVKQHDISMLRSFLGPSAVHSTSLAAVGSSSWQKNVYDHAPNDVYCYNTAPQKIQRHKKL